MGICIICGYGIPIIVTGGYYCKCCKSIYNVNGNLISYIKIIVDNETRK